MMAPTEILANQHYETIRHFLKGMGYPCRVIDRLYQGKRREAILLGLLSGEVRILIGTHALIEDTGALCLPGLGRD